ncbi:MAG: hypothetical protein JXR51_10620 [Bacteroidales bacterium]|nr:hypothetical protein [Bacteroidales bacterium]MBN2757620.1 hypothetical protein [Bacteroidales bacterium]
MKKILLFLILIVYNYIIVYGQESENMKQTKNTIHLDAAYIFITGMYSANYERQFFSKPHLKIKINIGYGGWYRMLSGNFTNFIDGKSIKLSTNILFGAKSHYFETDLGYRYVFFNEEWQKNILHFIRL